MENGWLIDWLHASWKECEEKEQLIMACEKVTLAKQGMQVMKEYVVQSCARAMWKGESGQT